MSFSRNESTHGNVKGVSEFLEGRKQFYDTLKAYSDKADIAVIDQEAETGTLIDMERKRLTVNLEFSVDREETAAIWHRK